jgi:hypothetical protein
MNIAAIDRIEAVPAPDAGVELAQFASRSSAFFLLGLALPASAALLIPFALIGLNPNAMVVLAARPVSAVLLACGLVAAGLALVYCLRAGFERLSGRHFVSIRDGQIAVEQRGLFGVRRWTQPLASYAGVAHHIRASLSGTRHEIVLVHQLPEHDVLLDVSPRSPVMTAAEVASRLGLPEVEARLIYRRQRPLAQTDSVISQLRAA